MPTYEYACTSCGHRLEAHQSFSDEPLTICSECGGTLRKVFGSVGIVLKGPGFYRTDSRNGSSKAPTPKEGGSEKVAAGQGSPASNGSSSGSSGSESASSSTGSSSSTNNTSSNGSSGSGGSGSSGGSAAKTATG